MLDPQDQPEDVRFWRVPQQRHQIARLRLAKSQSHDQRRNGGHAHFTMNVIIEPNGMSMSTPVTRTTWPEPECAEDAKTRSG